MGSELVRMVVAAISGVLCGLVGNAILYYGVQRREALRDRAIERLTERIQQLHDNDLKSLRDADAEQDAQRERIWKHITDELMPRSECTKVHEAASRSAEAVDRSISGLRADVSDVGRKTAGNEAILRLIAQRLKIQLNGSH